MDPPDGVHEVQKPVAEKSYSKWDIRRVFIAFWLLGMCNNYVYGIMLSAANDVIVQVQGNISHVENVTTIHSARECNEVSTGTILIADILPNLLVAMIFPFLPFLVHLRMVAVVLTGVGALIVVAYAESFTVALVGVCLASFNSGLGEISLLAYSTLFPLVAVAAWSSGTGGAGLVGSFAYAGMTEGGLTPQMALFVSLSIPILFAASFWLILKHPSSAEIDAKNRPKESPLNIVPGESSSTLAAAWANFMSNLTFIPSLLPFMIPLGLVYFSEYLINSGLFELLYFENTELSKSSQFRWYNAMYSMGVFVSRSSVSLIKIERVWIMALLQALNLVILILDAIYGYIPNVWIMFVIIFWEGLLGGSTYVNTYYSMSYKIPEHKRLFSMSIASTAMTFGIVSAGLSALPIHDAICEMPYNPVLRWPS